MHPDPHPTPHTGDPTAGHDHDGLDDDLDRGYDPDRETGHHPHRGDSERADDVVKPVDWNRLTEKEAKREWLDLNKWVRWLCHTYGLAPNIVPPLWHRHDELVWELSALHLHWLACYHEDASPSLPIVWHRDFAEARKRLREWVAACGTRLDHDRPTRQTSWPGEPVVAPSTERPITNRDEDFAAFVNEDLAARHARGNGERPVAGA